LLHPRSCCGIGIDQGGGRIKEAEEALGISLVETQVGGPDARRSSITDAASQLVKRYRRLREQVFSVVEKKFAEDIQAIVNEAASAPQTTASDI
jgi:molybdenum-dependent DNA-binding transcriptional regulator ModE